MDIDAHIFERDFGKPQKSGNFPLLYQVQISKSFVMNFDPKSS